MVSQGGRRDVPLQELNIYVQELEEWICGRIKLWRGTDSVAVCVKHGLV